MQTYFYEIKANDFAVPGETRNNKTVSEKLLKETETFRFKGKATPIPYKDGMKSGFNIGIKDFYECQRLLDKRAEKDGHENASFSAKLITSEEFESMTAEILNE